VPGPPVDGRDALGERLVRALSSARTDGEAIDAVLGEVARRLGSPLAVMWSVDETAHLLRWARDRAEGDALQELRGTVRRLVFEPGVGLPGRVHETRAAAWVEDVGADPGFPRAEAVLRSGLRSVVAAPVPAGERVLGVLEFFGRSVHAPSAEELADVTLAGRQLAAYLGRSHIEERLRATEEANASIMQAALDCIITIDHDGRVLDFNPAAELTFGYERDAVIGEVLADLIIPPPFRERHQRALARYAQTGMATILGRRLELEGMRADGSTFPVELTVSRLGTREPPVFAGFVRDISDRLALEREQSRLLTDALQARARAEAAQVRADAVREEAEEARAEAEQGRERIALLARAGRQMAESMDWEATLRAIVRSAVPAVADWSAITIADPRGRHRALAVAHQDPERERLAWELLQRYPSAPDAPRGPANVIRTGKVEVTEDISLDDLRAAAHDEEHLRLLTDLNVRHSAIAPLKTPAGVIGALSFLLGDSGRRFGPADLDLITSLAARAALHVQNSRLYTERSHIARTLQAGLRPAALPAIPGAELAARFRPAGDQNEVGGDFYDVFASGDGVWTALVGDVSGKGAEAAAITALARHTLRTGSMLLDDPAAILAVLNRALHAGSGPSDFCTVFCARLCPGGAALDLRFTNGGHPAPLLLRADGSVDAVQTGRGPLVGAVADAAFGDATLRVAPGELLLLYTDGVTEVRTSDVAIGERELRATLAAHAGGSAEEVVAAVERCAVALQDGEPRDDIALVAIKAVPA